MQICNSIFRIKSNLLFGIINCFVLGSTMEKNYNKEYDRKREISAYYLLYQCSVVIVEIHFIDQRGWKTIVISFNIEWEIIGISARQLCKFYCSRVYCKRKF